VSGAVVFGGYGVFGGLVCRELAAAGVAVTVAGRSQPQATALAQALGPAHRGVAVNVADLDSCRGVLQGQRVAVNCAGSLADLGPALLEAAMTTGCHYADIAVERPHAALVAAQDERFRARGLCAVYGCSSLPAVSGALAVRLRGQTDAVPWRARVTLFIGNDNPKGRGAVESLLHVLGRPLWAPQGTVIGYGDREVVPLPQPFGRRAVFNFDSPEYDLFPGLLGVCSVSVKVGFELRLTTYGFALLAALGWRPGPRTIDWLAWVGDRLRGIGSSGGAVMTELFYPDGSTRRACVLARRQGQRLAALPCALVTAALCRESLQPGAGTAYEVLGAERLLTELEARGYCLVEG
jgi:hypothetical protein